MKKATSASKKKTSAPNTAKDNIRVVSVFVGNKTASEVIHSAAVKKILYDTPKIS